MVGYHFQSVHQGRIDWIPTLWIKWSRIAKSNRSKVYRCEQARQNWTCIFFQDLKFIKTLEKRSLGVLMPHLKNHRALAPWVLARGTPWMDKSWDHQMFCWFKENPSPDQWSQGLTASQDFHMLLITKEPCMCIGSCMMRRVWKQIPFHAGLLTRNPKEM